MAIKTTTKTIRRVKLSTGNDKIGKITNLSLLPICSCDPNMPCAKTKQCYAYRFSCRPCVKDAWMHNTQFAKQDVDGFFSDLYYQLQGLEPRRFRWHVGGDCPTPEYVTKVVELAELLPETSFLIFSKRYEWWSEVLTAMPRPKNLSVYLSAWAGVEFSNPLRLPVAWTYNPKDPDLRIPPKVFNCLGSCQRCKHCWQSQSDVLFNKH